MARVKIPFSGISTTPSHEDGACRALVNLRPKRGSYKPVSPRKIMQSLQDTYDIVFVHKGAGYEKWIGTKGAAIYVDIRNTPFEIGLANENINSVEQIGNTLSFVTESSVFYALYKEGRYIFLGELPDIPAVQVKTSDKMAEAKLLYTNEYPGTLIDSLSGLLSSTKALIYKAMNLLVEKQGLHLFDAHFLRYAFRLYDNTLVRHSSPILIMPVEHVLDIKKYGFSFTLFPQKKIIEDSRVEVRGYKVYFGYDFSVLSNWTDIIKSVDFFLSDAIGFSNPELIRNVEAEHSESVVMKRVIENIMPESIKNLQNTSRFHYIKSAKLESIPIVAAEAFPGKDSEISKLENLKFQEEMSDDPFSHHRYGASSASSYNRRLRLSGVKTTFSKGFTPEMFMWFNTSLTDPGGGDPVSNYNGYRYALAPGPKFNALLFEVSINTGTEIKKVYKMYSSGFGQGTYKMFLSAFLSYPDPRAVSIVVYRQSGGSWHRVFSAPLSRHNGLNIAYFVSDAMRPIVEAQNPPAVSLPVDMDVPVWIVENNKLKVSELNNPFVFPVANTYSVGHGRILNEASVVMNVSDRNYGMYPVFVFTDTGVFTLSSQTSDSVHESMQAPAYMEPPISSVICPTPYGVAFITRRGLMLMNHREPVFLSPQLREDLDVLQIDSHGAVNSPFAMYPKESFSEYLEKTEIMIYNPYEDELIVCDKESDYAYVYNFPSKSFYLSTEKITQAVENVYPDVYVIGDGKLKDLSKSGGPSAEVGIVTRPIRIDATEDVKKMERVVLRSTMYNVNNASDKKALLIVYYSDDGINFEPARGCRLWKDGNYKDFDFGLFARTKRRQYLFSLFGSMNENSEIRFVEMEVKKEYDNEKMR